MEAKAKINIREGTVELEGSEVFVTKYLDEFKSLINKAPAMHFVQPSGQSSPQMGGPRMQSPPKKNDAPVSKGFVKSAEPIQFDIRADGADKPSLADFMKEKAPQSNKEIICCVAFYLKRYLNMHDFDEGHVSYAYLALKIKRPQAFHQAFIDTKNASKWIMNGEGGQSKWKLYQLGEDYVEHDLPRKQNAKPGQEPVKE